MGEASCWLYDYDNDESTKPSEDLLAKPEVKERTREERDYSPVFYKAFSLEFASLCEPRTLSVKAKRHFRKFCTIKLHYSFVTVSRRGYYFTYMKLKKIHTPIHENFSVILHSPQTVKFFLFYFFFCPVYMHVS